ncbi:MAG: hypothetical protein V3U76_15160 [Granulosicoccus sp.]
MAIASLLGKEAREHLGAALVLSVGTFAIVLLALAQNRAAAYSMSPFEVVRFSLITFLPLITLIVGNRLIVREYLSGTRLFVEALPVGGVLPLVLKYLLGFAFLSLLSAAMIMIAAYMAGIIEDVDGPYIFLMLGKTLVMVSLYWSIVFCFSLCGHLRIGLYLVTIGFVMLMIYYPGIDQSRFSPFALMDDQLFVFERDIVPWKDIAWTLVLSFAFTLSGFVLARVGEGSVADRLARPMTRRDYVALSILVIGGLLVFSTLVEKSLQESFEFSGDFVLRVTDPAVSVSYLEPEYREAGETQLTLMQDSLTAMQARLGLVQMPSVRLALDADREKHDIDYSTLDGVFITANWLEHDAYDDAIMEAVVLHGALTYFSGNRAPFEPYHWVLDGFTRWWVEQGYRELRTTHADELLARAQFALDRMPAGYDLVHQWQLMADEFAYPTAEALAWSAMSYLEEEKGTEVVVQLAREFLTKSVGENALAAIRDRRRSSVERFRNITGLEWQEFDQGWRTWVMQQAGQPSVLAISAQIPAFDGVVESVTDSSGVHHLYGGYQPLQSATAEKTVNNTSDVAGESGFVFAGSCLLKHELIGPFDTEFEVRDDNMDEQSCAYGDKIHSISSRYAPGDRVYVALEYETEHLHQPLRLAVKRLAVQ